MINSILQLTYSFDVSGNCPPFDCELSISPAVDVYASHQTDIINHRAIVLHQFSTQSPHNQKN